MATTRQFRVTTSITSRDVTQITPVKSILPLYTGEGYDEPTSITVFAGGSTSGAILGAARISLATKDILLAFGDPQTLDNEDAWELMCNTSTSKKTNIFQVSLELPTGEKRDFRWKGTRAVKGLWARFDTMHFKLEDEKTGELAAKFIHKSKNALLMEGILEVYWDLGGVWDTMIIISVLGLLKYTAVAMAGKSSR